MSDYQQAIRALQRKKSNKQCMECGERGPGYVCTNFNTFICTGCSGVLREFNFRVKGISMSTFTKEEVDNLEKGGNARAKKIYLATFKNDIKPPEPGNRLEIKEWVRTKYVDKRFMKGTKSKKSKKLKKKYSSSSSDSESSYAKRRGKNRNRKNSKPVYSSSSSSSSEEEERIRKKKTKGGKKKSAAKKGGGTDIKEAIPNAPKLVIEVSKKTGSKAKHYKKNKNKTKPATQESEPNLLDFAFDSSNNNPTAATVDNDGNHNRDAFDEDMWGDMSGADPVTQQTGASFPAQQDQQNFFQMQQPQQVIFQQNQMAPMPQQTQAAPQQMMVNSLNLKL